MVRSKVRDEAPRAARKRREQGFTLAELLLVVGILGILATITIPNFIKLVHKSKRTEAYAALGAIYTAQKGFQGEKGVFADTFDELGFELTASSRLDARTIEGPHYTYTLQALPVDGNARRNFRAIATGDIDPGDPVLDILLIENTLTVLE
jgi:prepilin-type N-terminal cleavage/methylation domain-containing protein